MTTPTQTIELHEFLVRLGYIVGMLQRDEFRALITSEAAKDKQLAGSLQYTADTLSQIVSDS